MTNSLFIEGRLHQFIHSDQPFIIWSIPDKEETQKNFDLVEKVMNVNGEAKPIDMLHLKFTTLNLIFDFFRLCKEYNIIEDSVPVEYNDRFDLSRVEHYLNNNLFEDFPGIDFLARKFNISESKLKTEFKNMFGKPIFQYFQEKKMHLAKELLRENQMLIKEISYKFGYENTSKFSAAFKKHNGILPSEI